MTVDRQDASGPGIVFLRGGVPDDPRVARAIAIAIGTGTGATSAPDAPSAWWRAGTSEALTGRLVRSPDELERRYRAG